MKKIYKLEIPRNHYDHIGSAFTEPNGMYAVGFDVQKDTVIFTISEQLRERDNPKIPERWRATYWITQMFLPHNIEQYLVK